MGATIHQLPPVRRGRIRKSQSMDAAGECSLIRLKHFDQPSPENVVRLKDMRKREVPAPSPELSLLSAILAQMTFGQLNDVQQTLKRWRNQGDRSATLAFNLLDRSLNP